MFRSALANAPAPPTYAARFRRPSERSPMTETPALPVNAIEVRGLKKTYAGT